MLDLETMGTTADAAIIAIGAVVFMSYGLEQRFYMPVSLKSSVENGGIIDPDTVLWWMKQSDKARAEFSRETNSITHALNSFSVWIDELYEIYYDDPKIWGNGASFDNVILASAYRRAGIKQPWSFWNDRCFRTLKNTYPTIEVAERQGTHHNALDDAIHQAAHALEINIQHKLGELQ